MRDDGWDSFLEKVHRFCEQHYIDVLKMDDTFTRWALHGHPHRNPPEVTNLHHYRVDLFYGIIDMKLPELNDRFSDAGLKELGDLSEKLVMSKKNMVYPLVYKLLTLALILPVAMTTVERVFSAIRIVKDRLRNRMSDDWMNDSLIVYVEKDIFLTVDNESIVQRFQNMKTRKEQL
ncbi:uncharacterized protein [Primulina eburnea]|uniref:uncharacterized protein n=1 Tax=Primulina eburnea TaxID=1245227 RepID=UPI003C6C6DDB